MDGRCRLRPATASDVAPIAALERAIFSDPWSADSIRETIGMAWIFTQVVEDGAGRIIGYVFCREVAGESELLNIAVDPAARRGGIGKALLDAALGWATERGAVETFLEVRASNVSAIAMYEREGFRAVGRRPDYYQHPVEDAILYRRPADGRA